MNTSIQIKFDASGRAVSPKPPRMSGDERGGGGFGETALPAIRRQDRLLDDAGQERLLDEGEYGFLAMSTNAGGYGVPISFVREKTKDGREADRIYFHCALAGRKIAALEKDNRVSFCVVGRTQVLPAQFSTAYESVMVFGRVAMRLSEEERRAALRLLVKKYCPGVEAEGEAYAEKLFQRTRVLRLDIERRMGKRRVWA